MLGRYSSIGRVNLRSSIDRDIKGIFDKASEKIITLGLDSVNTCDTSRRDAI